MLIAGDVAADAAATAACGTRRAAAPGRTPPLRRSAAPHEPGGAAAEARPAASRLDGVPAADGHVRGGAGRQSPVVDRLATALDAGIRTTAADPREGSARRVAEQRRKQRGRLDIGTSK